MICQRVPKKFSQAAAAGATLHHRPPISTHQHNPHRSRSLRSPPRHRLLSVRVLQKPVVLHPHQRCGPPAFTDNHLASGAILRQQSFCLSPILPFHFRQIFKIHDIC